jgi:hypothetical protein
MPDSCVHGLLWEMLATDEALSIPQEALRDSLKLNFPKIHGILQNIIDWRYLYGID